MKASGHGQRRVVFQFITYLIIYTPPLYTGRIGDGWRWRGGGYIQMSRILVDKDLCLLLVDKHSQYLTIKIQEVRGGGKGLQEVWGFRRYGEGVEGMGLQEVGRGVEGI